MCLKASRALREPAVVGVGDPDDMPAIGEEPAGDVFAEGEIGVTFDGHVVVVVDPAQIGSFRCPASEAGLARDPLHEVAVAAET